jgi:Flp pilus assembly protein TadB
MNDLYLNNAKDPKLIYKKILEKRQTQLKNILIASDRLSTARLAIFTFSMVIIWLSLVENYLSLIWAYASFIIFLSVVIFHSWIVKRQKKIERSVAFFTRRLDHIAGKWSGWGNCGNRYSDTNHPYSSDLDLFGDGSLYEFLCGARTRIGKDMLAVWLSRGADPKTIVRRQQAVEELCDLLKFHEEMFQLDAESNKELNSAELQHWVEQAYQIPHWQRVLATLLGVAAILSIAAWAMGYGYSLLLIVIIFEIPFYALSYRVISHISASTEQASSTLVTLVQALHLIEQHSFNTPLLQQLSKNLQSDGQSPSWQINRLANLINQLNQSTRNQIYMPFALLFGLPIHLSFQIEQWRKQIGTDISRWLDTVGQIEALSSLALYSFENPDNPFPEIITEAGEPCFNAVELCHPLIPGHECVDNNIRIDSERRLIMVSGSNMSGKSTLLRAIGVNVVLACCGAPVQAKSLKTSCFIIGAAMRANDSLKQGTSHFYAVISKIKRVVELAEQSPPLLFLLDEILQGTNSHDRLIGAKGIINHLIKKKAVGLVTTHDLALTDIVDSLNNQAINIHFRDHLVNGNIHFDYKIHNGVIQKSNGLELMKMVGLDMNYETTE